MVKILDCTLRDGGYYTNWDFDKKLVEDYIKYMELLPVEYIEIGYRSIEKDEYFGEYFYLPVSTIKNIKERTSKKLSIMLNAKDCNDVDLKALLWNIKDDVELIRIATDPLKIEFSLELAKALKKMGFQVVLNIMYISKLDEKNIFFEYVKNIENYVDVIYLVDSYGSIYPDDLKNLITRIRSLSGVSLGFHGHNNIELALANTLEALKEGIEFIDSTVLGMGRGAGNLKTELLLTYLNSKKDMDIDLNILGKLVDIFKPLYLKYSWGTNLAYMVSGAFSLPQKDVMEALEINRYSISGIVNHIKNTKSIKLPFFKHQKMDHCLIIGGGESIKKDIKAIYQYLKTNKNIVIIHSTSKYIELFEELEHTQIFAVAGDELLKVNDTKSIDKYVLEPRPRKIDVHQSYAENYFELEKIDFIDAYYDSPFTISLQIAVDIKAKNIDLVGFDGYKQIQNNKEFYLMHENQEIIKSFVKDKNLVSLTKSEYKYIKQRSIYSKIDG